MPLESTILCVDNSEYMRNGDYIPNRALAQQDAVNMICHSKTRSNPENNVGLITMADKQVLVTLTTDSGKIMNQMHLVQPNGLIDFLTSIKIAHLALKHRQGRNHKMKIIVFIGSPVEVDEKELVKIAKKLKKEKVNVDIVNFGETLANTDKMTTFINTINGKEGTGSHIITIPPGPVLSEALMTSPIMVDDSDGTGAGMSGSGYSGGSMMSGFDFGIDPNSDPELALALRVSMEEQRARQEAEARAAQQGGENDVTKSDTKPAMDAVITELAMEGESMGGMSEEEALLNRALAMSMGAAEAESQDLTEEEQIALALQMSLQPEETEQMDVSMDTEHDQNKKGSESSNKAKDKP